MNLLNQIPTAHKSSRRADGVLDECAVPRAWTLRASSVATPSVAPHARVLVECGLASEGCQSSNRMMCISKTPAHIGSSADTPLSNGRFESFTDPCGSQEAVERALQAREAAAQAYVQARPASRFWTEAPTPRTGGNRAPLRAPRPKTADENLQLERHRMRLHGEMLGTLKRREPSPSPRRQATLRNERVGVTSYKEFSDSSPPPHHQLADCTRTLRSSLARATSTTPRRRSS